MIELGIVGVGAIAHKQHKAAVDAHAGFSLAASASHDGAFDGVPAYREMSEMLAAHPEISAVTLCVPPRVRTRLALEAIQAGKHVFLEKPPGQTVAEVLALEAAAKAAGVTLFASWHSRYAAAVEPLKAAIAEHGMRGVQVPWREDARIYHPGQRWIWEDGGFGCFDPGINALSILTHVLPAPFYTEAAKFWIPENATQPVRAELLYRDTVGRAIEALFDFDHPEPAEWSIIVETDGPTLPLSGGGKRLMVGDAVAVDAPDAEYLALYDLFAGLVAGSRSDVDLLPLIHCSDAFLVAERKVAPAFVE